MDLEAFFVIVLAVLYFGHTAAAPNALARSERVDSNREAPSSELWKRELSTSSDKLPSISSKVSTVPVISFTATANQNGASFKVWLYYESCSSVKNVTVALPEDASTAIVTLGMENSVCRQVQQVVISDLVGNSSLTIELSNITVNGLPYTSDYLDVGDWDSYVTKMTTYLSSNWTIPYGTSRAFVVSKAIAARVDEEACQNGTVDICFQAKGNITNTDYMTHEAISIGYGYRKSSNTTILVQSHYYVRMPAVNQWYGIKIDSSVTTDVDYVTIKYEAPSLDEHVSAIRLNTTVFYYKGQTIGDFAPNVKVYMNNTYLFNVITTSYAQNGILVLPGATYKIPISGNSDFNPTVTDCSLLTDPRWVCIVAKGTVGDRWSTISNEILQIVVGIDVNNTYTLPGFIMSPSSQTFAAKLPDSFEPADITQILLRVRNVDAYRKLTIINNQIWVDGLKIPLRNMSNIVTASTLAMVGNSFTVNGTYAFSLTGAVDLITDPSTQTQYIVSGSSRISILPVSVIGLVSIISLWI